MSDKIIRKIAVIFVTDVVSFSKLMERDEDQTLQSFRACKSILDNLFEEHSGRIFNTAGDSVLAEFPSAVSAVICAAEFQKLVKERNASVEPLAEMHFRVGLNMGDVIVEGHNLYGDGVNVAARLEALSQPDGVCLSKSIHDFVSQKVDLAFKDLGDQKVKNTIVHAFDMTLEGMAVRELKQTASDVKSDGGTPPAIAVLPFKNMSNDEEQEYFADGVTEDIIGHLSLWKTFPVISRNSSFSFKATALTTVAISKKLNVRYLVEGSIRKGGNKVRISASLIDAEQDKQIWSDRWDRPMDDIFDVQDEISLAIARKVNPTIRSEERAKVLTKTSTNASAWDTYLRALDLYNKRSETKKIHTLCDQAIAIDKTFIDPYALKCRTLIRERYIPQNRQYHDKISKQIFEISTDILNRDKNNSDALNCMCSYYMSINDATNAAHYAKLAEEANPNNAQTANSQSLISALTGDIESATTYLEKVKFLDPSELDEWPQFEVSLLMVNKRLGEALEQIQRAISKDPGNNMLIGFLVAVLGNLDRLPEAREKLAQFREMRPDITTLEDYGKVVPEFAKEVILKGMANAGLS
ncbi:MAG: adenylate/guanylate cyclase domain-containing protein [Marinovum sp.]|nr:adenylate/guanylate cyclase domain-containing protein [Marinovum sp.]